MAAKVFTYMLTMTGVMLLMAVGGISLSSQILTAISYGDLSLITSGSFFILISGVFLITGAAVVVGLLTSQSATSFIKAGLCLSLLYWFVADMMSLIFSIHASCPIGSSCAWTYWIIVLFALPLAVGYLISAVEWWEGTD